MSGDRRKIPASEIAYRQRKGKNIRAALGRKAYKAALEEGRALKLEGLVSEVLPELTAPSQPH